MKLSYEYFNKDTGEAIITLKNKYGSYTGKAQTHPDDKPYINELVGCRLAEKRAWLVYFKKELQRQKIKLNTLQNLNKDIQNTFSDKINPAIQRRINLKLRDYSNNIIELNQTIFEIKNSIKKDIELRDSLIKRRTKEENK